MSFLRSLYHYLLAWFGNAIYQHPSRRIFVIGVTGTKGKSTVMELINAILEAANKKTVLISSVRFKIDRDSRLNLTGMTMPGRFFIPRFLKKAVEKNCQYAIIEVTSQGVLQYRHRFLDFDAAVITNLEPEHIEAHGSFEKYRESKVSFFKDTALNSRKPNKLFLINSGARDNEYFISAAGNSGKVVLYNKNDLEKFGLKPKLLGDFNMENIAAAVSLARALRIDWETIKTAIENFDGVPGRLEFVQKDPFSVVIDYAHTPDSLEKVYQAIIKSRDTKGLAGQLICVFGSAGGGRDVWKRPVMGQVAAKHCDKIILTNEDPFDDDPKEIVQQISQGIKNSGFNINYKIVLDRQDAIRSAIKGAQKGDAVIITGKGIEPYIRTAHGKKIPWNEKEVVQKILNEEKIEI